MTVSPRTRLPRSSTLLLGVMVVAAFALLINETLLSVALPTLMRELDISATTANWLTTIFMLTMAVITPAGGSLLQRFSARQAFTLAMGTFLVGTVLAAAAPGFVVLLVARALQAAATAVMVPLLMTTILRVLPADGRGAMLGVVALVMAAAPALGPTIGGVILSIASWHWLFLTVTPIAVLALVVGMRLIPADEERPGAIARVDVTSATLAAVGFGGLVMGLSNLGVQQPLVEPSSCILLALFALALFIRRQLHAATPFFNLRVLGRRDYRWAIIVSSTVTAAMLGVTVVLPLYTQNVLGVSTTTAGLLVLPGALAQALLAPVVGAAADRVSLRTLALPGAILLTTGIGVMATMSQGTSLVTVVIAHVVMSLGVVMVNSPFNVHGLNSLDELVYSHGTSLMTTIQQVCGAAASALFIAIMTARAAASPGMAGMAAAEADGTQAALQVAAIAACAVIALVLVATGRKSVTTRTEASTSAVAEYGRATHASHAVGLRDE